MSKSIGMKLSAVALAVMLSACDNSNEPQAPAQAEPAKQTSAQTAVQENQVSAAQQMQQVFDEHWEATLRENPLNATFMGDDRFNDTFGDFGTEEGMARSLQMSKDYLAKIMAVDATQLAGQDLLSYEIFKSEREAEIESYQFPDHLMPLQQFYNPYNFVAMLGSGQSAQPFKTVKDYENWLSRMREMPEASNVMIANMREGMESGVVRPRALMEKVLPQLKAHMGSDVESSLFYGPVSNMPESFSEEDKSRLTKEYVNTIQTQVVPAYAAMHDFIQDEYLAQSSDVAGMVGLPNGKDWYAFMVKQTTSTDLTPDQIHQIGLDEVARIHEEMKSVMKEVGFEGDLQAFFEFTKTDPQFIFDTKEDMLQAYESLREQLDNSAPNFFKVIPKAEFEIRAVEPFREQSASGASYQGASPDGTRPGIFYVNTYDLSARPNWAVESLYLHEAVPGHHFQRSIQQELEELPKFRRYGGTTAYVEGWGLYAESLGKDMGVYTDPYQYFGALSAELWRAIRLVVDTGLHAKGWTRQEVLDYMEANSPVAEARRVSEAERFMAIPSQALAYKVGQLKIRELRTLAEETLGDKFDVREFHHEVLKDGALPLNVLHTKIVRWIESVK